MVDLRGEFDVGYSKSNSVVIAGLDPAIPRLRKHLAKGMDARVIWREDALRAFARA
jgi:hypothetical protein